MHQKTRFSIPHHLFYTIIVSAILGVGFLLLWSVLRSGVGYGYDGDEVYHAQFVYLLGHGYKPFTSFYLMYSPVYHAFLLPVFVAMGYSFQTLSFVRLLMVILFVIRLVISYTIARKIFSTRVGLLFVFLLLLNPFAVFSEMQIRPDNLMMLVYSLGVLLLIYAHQKAKSWLFVASGILVSFAFLINVKIFPSIGILFLVYGYWSFSRRSFRELLLFLFGFAISFTVFSTYFLAAHSFVQMVTQMIIDPQTVLGSVAYPTHVGFFYLPDNVYIYGLSGKPLTWVYVWVLPLLAFSGLFHLISSTAQNKTNDKLSSLRIFLALSLVAQWLLLFMIQTVFIQYYIPINWLFALFAAYGIVSLGNLLKPQRVLASLFTIGIGLSLLVLIRVSIIANNARSSMQGLDVIAKFERVWKTIPEGMAVFPYYLFRPIGYPLLDIVGVRTEEIGKRYGDVSIYLESKRVPFVFRNDYMAGYYSPQTNAYIDAHYVKDPTVEELFVRVGD